MALTQQQTADIESAMADFLATGRTPVELREKMEIGFRIKGQSVVIFERRPFWPYSDEMIERVVAKATYVRRTHCWRIYWQRADLKWHAYYPQAEALLFEEFIALVDEDESACFWG
ncbi:MAG: DUF3024 domain-containing protein [Akkermansiaceae bacterium]|nr:DUF3024 domain-containing protein [Akkermansiaceae bacterium]MCF7730115.1 DUF3024 domain-containing protein [Akkermansiaceae bacterium]